MLKTPRKVGVIGLTYSGKTTFITSLLDHWSKHHPQRFSLGQNQDRLWLDWRGKPSLNGKHVYERHRNALGEGEWLPKTLECQRYEIVLRSNSWWSSMPLTLVDIPGERLADGVHSQIADRETP